MARLEKGTWVLVLDGAKGLILEAGDDGLSVIRKEEQDNPPDRDQKTDRPGRQHESGSARRSAIEETDYHRLEETRFAEATAATLYAAAHRGRFERLVIVAGPQILGALRPALHKEVSDKVVAEIPKTLTGQPVGAIETAVREALAAA